MFSQYMKRPFKAGDEVICKTFAMMPCRFIYAYEKRPHYQALYVVDEVLPNGKLKLKGMYIDNILTDKETGWKAKHFIHAESVRNINDV